jgi:hypothetical protein
MFLYILQNFAYANLEYLIASDMRVSLRSIHLI